MICLVNAFAKHRHRSGSTVIGLTCVINERSQVWRGWQFYHNSVFWPSNAFLHVIIPKFNYIWRYVFGITLILRGPTTWAEGCLRVSISDWLNQRSTVTQGNCFQKLSNEVVGFGTKLCFICFFCLTIPITAPVSKEGFLHFLCVIRPKISHDLNLPNWSNYFVLTIRLDLFTKSQLGHWSWWMLLIPLRMIFNS